MEQRQQVYMKDSSTCIIAAGGTGGHIYPALAVAKKLHHSAHRIIWLGAKTAVERKILDPMPWQYDAIQAAPFRGVSWHRKIFAIIGVIKSLFTCLQYILRFRPKLVIVTGGYVGLSMGLIAKLTWVPLFVCEQNAKPGTVNKLLSYLADRVFTAYPGVFPNVKKDLVIECGNPIRDDIASYAQIRAEQNVFAWDGVFTIMVMGGSQGAEILNKNLPRLLGMIADKERVHVIHQCGKGKSNPTEISAAYKKYGIQAQVLEYYDNIVEVYQKAHLVISRAGASSLSEISAVALPSILIPLPHAIDDHQNANAKHLEDKGGCWVVPERRFVEENICANLITVLLNNTGRYQRMCQAAQSFSKTNATEILLKNCNEYLS